MKLKEKKEKTLLLLKGQDHMIFDLANFNIDLNYLYSLTCTSRI